MRESIDQRFIFSKNIVWFSVIGLYSIQIDAQSVDSLLNLYDSQSIYHSGSRFLKGNRKLNFSDLNVEFKSEVTKGLYSHSRKHLLFSRLLNVASV